MKNTTQKILTLLFAFVVIWITPNVGKACSCSMSPTVDIAFERTPNVAIFKLQSVEKATKDEKNFDYGGIKQAKLTVEKVFKGNLKVGQELTFAQGGGADCVWTFSEESIGGELLFYLGDKPKSSNVWFAGTCSRSNTIKGAAADLLYLEKLAKVRGKTRLSGTLTQSIETSVEDEEDFYNRLAGKKVKITGNGKNITLKTDENGVYEIYDLPVGKYKISVESIAGYTFSANKENSVEVVIKAKSHTEENFYFSIDNEIKGKVFDSKGKPLEDVCLNLIPARGKKAEYFSESDCTDKDGIFRFEGVPAGVYLIVINDDGEISSDEPFGTFYYPSATKREEATEISVSAGSFYENLIVTAPQTAETITVSGILLFENGKPAADEFVEFITEKETDKTEDDSEDSDAQTKTDKNGRFTIKILKGQKGKLFGLMYSYIGQYENCPKLDKLIREKGGSVEDIKTPSVFVEAIYDLSEIELKFPFPSCKKAK